MLCRVGELTPHTRIGTYRVTAQTGRTAMNQHSTIGPAARGVLVGVWTLLCVDVGGLASAEMRENPLGLKIHHITALVAQLPRAIDWYHSVLGFSLVDQGEHGPVQFAVMRIPDFEVALIKTPDVDASPPATLKTPHWVHIVFSVTDPNQLFHALKARGEKPYVRGPEPTGLVESFLIKDSEGNEIEIVSAGKP